LKVSRGQTETGNHNVQKDLNANARNRRGDARIITSVPFRCVKRVWRAALAVAVFGLFAGCGASSSTKSATCKEVHASSTKADALARVVLGELESLRASSRFAPEGGDASVAQDKAQAALFNAGYRAVVASIDESCKGLGPGYKPYESTVSGMAGELGLPSPTSEG
jgi:hypothetical protein